MEVPPLYLSSHPLWLHVPPSIQRRLTTPVGVTYVRMLAGQELYVNSDDSIHINPAAPDCLVVRSVEDFEAIQLQHVTLQYGYEALAVAAHSSLQLQEYSPQQCLALEAAEATHCFVFHSLAEGTAWHSAVRYLTNRLQASVDRELAAVFDLRAVPKLSEKWREFEITLVTELGNSLERLVVDYTEESPAASLKDFLQATGKRLCPADFKAVASLLQSFPLSEKQLDGSQIRVAQGVMPYTPSPHFAADEAALREFAQASKAGDALRCELQINLRLAKRKTAFAQGTLEFALADVQLQKLGIIFECVTENGASPLRIHRQRRLTGMNYLGNTLEVGSARTSLRVRSSHRSHVRATETARISLEPPSLDDSPKSKDCQVF